MSEATTDVVAWCGGIVAIAGVLGIAWRGVVQPVRHACRKAGHFLDDWFGEEARPGVPGRPGVMERLDDIEHQLRPNGGTSMRDALDRVDARTARIAPDD